MKIDTQFTKQLGRASKQLCIDIANAYWTLLKIMVPALIVVKLLETFGATHILASTLEPLMSSIGLPSEAGLVWAAAILTNVYTAMVVFYEISASHSFSIDQVSILGILILLGHAIPIEGRVAKAFGLSWRLTILTRVGGGYVLALTCYGLLQFSEYGDVAAQSVWQPTPTEEGLLPWLWTQAEMLLGILVILAALMLFLRALKLIGFDKVLGLLLRPLTLALNIHPKASNVTIIGLMLGLSFGAGLLINESKKGQISQRDMKIVVCFLGLCHSIIEDTILILLLGADILPILLGRLIFSTLAMMIFARFALPIKHQTT